MGGPRPKIESEENRGRGPPRSKAPRRTMGPEEEGRAAENQWAGRAHWLRQKQQEAKESGSEQATFAGRGNKGFGREKSARPKKLGRVRPV